MSPGGCAGNWGWGGVRGTLFQALLAGSYVSVVCAVEMRVSVDFVIVGLLLFQCSSGLPAHFSVDMFSCVLIALWAKLPLAFPRGRRFPLAAGVQ